MTPAAKKFLERVAEGRGWFVPAQALMVRRLAKEGLVVITDERRYNPLRGSSERLAAPPTGPESGAA